MRFVGDIVAAVVAETQAQAVDAAETRDRRLRPAARVVDAEAALADGAPVLFHEHGSNVAIAIDFGEDPTICSTAPTSSSRADSSTSASRRCRWSPTASSPCPTARRRPRGDVPTQAPHGVRDAIAAAARPRARAACG